jgi:polyisoprenoid-binding protein YceI
MEFVAGSVQKGSVHLTINVGSLEIMDEVSSADRREIERVMFDEVLEKNIYPRIEYKSSQVIASKIGENVYRVSVVGDLTLHGVTRGMGLDAQVMAGEDTVRAQGSFSLRQSDFALKIASVAGGTLKLRDELRCGYFILGRRKE